MTRRVRNLAVRRNAPTGPSAPKLEDSAFAVDDRVQFVYPNERTGSGTIESVDPDTNRKPYTVRLDKPWRAYREGRWQVFTRVYAHASLLRRVDGDE